MKFLDRFRKPKRRRGSKVGELLDGYRATCVIVTALELGLFERLASGPATAANLAAALGAHPVALRRLLDALAGLGLAARRDDEYRSTGAGRKLLADGPGARDLATLIGAEYLPAWTALRHSVLTGEPAFPAVFGKSVWEHRHEHPELGAAFDRFMARVQARTAGAVIAAFDFSRASLVVDVGGGHGGVLAGILARHSSLRGVLFDQQDVVAAATGTLAAAGVADRCRRVGGSFFAEVPAGGDVYLLQHVLHDWDDERCRAILTSCRKAMTDRGTLLVVESIVPEGTGPGRELALRDLHMLVVLGGRERTRGEYSALLAETGFEIVRCTAAEAGGDVIEARPAASR